MTFHRPEFYRYRASAHWQRPILNRYGWQIIGAAFVARGYAYCVKWAWTA